MNAYQNFLEFFSMHNKERLDGLSEIYFTSMTPQEKEMAFEYLLRRVETGGTEESVNGLFLADANRAVPAIQKLLINNKLSDEAEISAAWNLYKHTPDRELLSFFIQPMSSKDERIRAKAAYYAPSEPDRELISALKEMVRKETDLLASINATDKLLACYELMKDSVSEEDVSKLYNGLRNDDFTVREHTLRKLDLL